MAIKKIDCFSDQQFRYNYQSEKANYIHNVVCENSKLECKGLAVMMVILKWELLECHSNFVFGRKQHIIHLASEIGDKCEEK